MCVSLCACVCVYVRACMCVCVYFFVCMHAQCACVCLCMCACMHVCICLCLCVCVLVCVSVCVRACMCACVHVCVHLSCDCSLPVDLCSQVFNLCDGTLLSTQAQLHVRRITAMMFFNPLKFLITGSKDGSSRSYFMSLVRQCFQQVSSTNLSNMLFYQRNYTYLTLPVYVFLKLECCLFSM